MNKKGETVMKAKIFTLAMAFALGLVTLSAPTAEAGDGLYYRNSNGYGNYTGASTIPLSSSDYRYR